jgi:hypothetical protein
MLFTPASEIPEISKAAEKEQRLADYKDYLAGIDLVFGLEQGSLDREKEKAIKEKANLVADRWLTKGEGTDVYVNEGLIGQVETRLGRAKTREYLSVFKDEVFDKMVNPDNLATKNLELQRKEASKELFMTEKVRKITF